MKRMILAVTVAAFALVPAMQAGESCCPSAKAASANKAACADKAKSGCPFAAKNASQAKAKSGCCPSKAMTVKKAQSPKGAQLAKS